MTSISSETSTVSTTSTAPRPSWVTVPAMEPAPALLDFLDRRFPRVGREVWRSRLEAGKVLGADGRPLSAGWRCRAGARLAYFREVVEEPRVPFEEEVVYRSEHLLAADKPPFLPVVPGGRFVNECLLYRLQRRVLHGSSSLEGLAPLHRLDRHTSGLVLFGLTPESRGAYGALFASGRIERSYLAVARAPQRPAWEERTVASRIVPGEPFFRMREAVGEPNAVTRVRLLDHRPGRALLELRPETGKKHQLRLHLASIGCPIVGDRLYPELLREAADDPARPLQLLAWRLRFTDPLSGEAVALESRRRLQAAWSRASSCSSSSPFRC